MEEKFYFATVLTHISPIKGKIFDSGFFFALLSNLKKDLK